jgi:hypothetical protein
VIFSGATNSQDLETFAYHQDHLVVVMPKGHPLATKKSKGFPNTCLSACRITAEKFSFRTADWRSG